MNFKIAVKLKNSVICYKAYPTLKFVGVFLEEHTSMNLLLLQYFLVKPPICFVAFICKHFVNVIRLYFPVFPHSLSPSRIFSDTLITCSTIGRLFMLPKVPSCP
jgi:hypothetical protein